MAWRETAIDTLAAVVRVIVEPGRHERVRLELQDLPPGELDRILGEHHATLQNIATASDSRRETLVPARLAAAGLDEAFVRQTLPRLFDALETSCSRCGETSRCMRDLEHADATARLSSYCPNAEVVDRLIVATSRLTELEPAPSEPHQARGIRLPSL